MVRSRTLPARVAATVCLGSVLVGASIVLSGGSDSVVARQHVASSGRLDDQELSVIGSNAAVRAVRGRDCVARSCTGTPYPPRISGSLSVCRGCEIALIFRRPARRVSGEVGWVRRDYGRFTALASAQRADRRGLRWRMRIPRRGLQGTRLLAVSASEPGARSQEFWVRIKLSHAGD